MSADCQTTKNQVAFAFFDTEIIANSRLNFISRKQGAI